MVRFADDINTKDIRYTRAYIVDDEKAIDLETHRINFVVSSDVIDRSGEIVEASAVFDAIQREGEFKACPVCLIGHRHHLNTDEPPSIGNWDVATARLRKHYVEMFLQFDIELKLGAQYWIAYKNKTMRAVSIGFRIKDYRVEEQKGRRVLIITEIELVEISVCAVGMNPQALSTLKAIGINVEEILPKQYEFGKDLPDGTHVLLEASALKHHLDFRILESNTLTIDGKEVLSITKMEPIAGSVDTLDPKAVNDRIDRLEESLVTSIDGIKDLIASDHGDLARKLMSGSSKELEPAADNNTGLDVVGKALQNMLTELKSQG
ncbi:MAG: HK97 family phage prohead protease [Planctomycetaceae bacterium]|nr:HK97 family phage prohead protease [Planctomycetaceae bacterium]